MGIFSILLIVTLAPLLPGIINRTKAVFAGRCGPPLLQLYFDIFKLMKKGVVYSATTSWVFRAAPIVLLASVLAASALMPLGAFPSLCSFAGDFILFAYLLGLGRLFVVMAALDTGSAFEGMGSSREVFFASLSEVVLFACLVLLTLLTGKTSLSGLLTPVLFTAHSLPWATLMFALVSLLVVTLVESARVPVDDPNTHLELTMIHEVMVLDHSGPDLAFIEYASAVKLLLLCLMPARLLVPFAGDPVAFTVGSLVVVLLVAVLIGTIESVMARVQLLRVPQLITGALAVATLGTIFLLR